MISPGVRLGRYEVLSPLGAGGMGEVYRARDTELDRKVALKVLPEEVASDHDRLKRFEREARATAALSHPNVLTVFDVGREDGRSYLVFELLEGSTLGTRLATGRLSPDEALGYAVQIARGLAAAHARGIVHRDLKPDNLFLTTRGVVKVLDFGLARVQPSDERETTASDVSRPGTVMGTVSYMSPEQAKGHPGDARSDMFALGTVLYEMLSGKHPFRRNSSAETLTAILRDEPPDLLALTGGVPMAVERIARRCLEKRAEDRFQTANDLALALEAVSQGEPPPRARGAAEAIEADDRPYPGLSSFTQADAARFFGREAEITALWAKLRRQSLLGLIGPSGVGKTSFLRAGLIPHAPAGWAAAYSTPGQNPALGLAQALTHDLAGDPATLTELMEGVGRFMRSGETDGVVAAVERWRRRASEALLVVDQFEELFTLNAEETQGRFASLLGRLSNEAEVRVLLSLRDDFLFRCGEREGLRPVFQDLTPLYPPSPDALRRALVEPAARLGVRFEDEALVAEMVAAVGKERGALPPLAFAVSRLWDQRDQEKKLLTRAAYVRIGGVAGALAQHAEATLREVGPGQEAVVREIFRNLVTAEGTRAARERQELLSVFAAPLAEPRQAATVLDQLVDSRLLTEYQAADPPPSPVASTSDEAAGSGPSGDSQRIEIVHESLLTHWPRLERWLAQDAEGALLRDQLRLAAHLWDEKGRTDELLWTGRAYREYALWRERYAGRLSTLEEDFATAMTRLARRRRTRRRMAVGALVAGALAVAVVTLGLWRQSEVARRAAEAEARRREAAEILALGRGKLADDPTTALAYALASLEKADSPDARRFAVEALWRGPTALLMPPPRGYLYQAWFSSRGNWLATFAQGPLFAWSRRGGPPLDLNPSSAPDSPQVKGFGFAEDESSITTVDDHGLVRVWSLPEGRVLRSAHLEGLSDEERQRTNYPVVGERIIGHTPDPPDPSSPNGSHVFRSWASAGGPPKFLGRIGGSDFYDLAGLDVPRLWVIRADGRITFQRLDKPGAEAVTVGVHPKADWLRMSRDRHTLSSATEDGEVRLWRIVNDRLEPWRTLRGPGDVRGSTLDSLGWFLAGAPLGRGAPAPFVLWDLRFWPDAAPVPLKKWAGVVVPGDFSPDGAWMVSAHEESAALWRLRDQLPRRLQPSRGTATAFAFSPDSRRLAVSGMKGTLEIFPVQADAPARSVLRDHGNKTYEGVLWDPAGRFLLTAEGRPGGERVRVILVPLDGGRERVPPEPEGGRSADRAWPILLAPDGQHVVIGVDRQGSSELRVWDLRSNKVHVLPPLGPDCSFYGGQSFLGPDRFVTNMDELRLWDLASGESTRLKPCEKGWNGAVQPTPDGRQIVLGETYGPSSYGTSQERQTMKRTRLYVFDLASRRERFITTHGDRQSAMTLDPTGTIVVTGDQLGVVRVGPLTGEEPHLLYGHTSPVGGVTVSPDGKWIASRGEDGIRLWPMPKGRPLHTLPDEELLAKLRSLTNLRLVADPAAATGFRTEVGAFPGWATPLEW